MPYILNIAGYKFIPLQELAAYKEKFLTHLTALGIKGTILLSTEGININLAGAESAILEWLGLLKTTPFADIKFHRTFSSHLPFKRLKVKIKKEIITLRQPSVNVSRKRAPHLAPLELKQWLDENRDFVLLDTRNDYEIEKGTFAKAQALGLQDFSEFPEKLESLDKAKPIVMFCTGGIRCEKAACFMEQQGFKEVYQLDGGILGYFAQVGMDHYQGKCFVFDDRVSLRA